MAHQHHHGVMTGLVVGPYDLIVGGLLMRGTYAAIAELLDSRVSPGGTVLDVGTGPGRMPTLLARRRPDLTVIGIDPSADMLVRARRRANGIANLRFEAAGAESIPLADGSVDAVVSSLSSHHWADLDAALAEQTRVLQPGGQFWLLDLKRELADDIGQRVGRAGLTLLDAPNPLGRGVRRRFGLIAATKPG